MLGKLLPLALTLPAFASPSYGQGYDILPAYEPEGPGGGLVEVFLDAPLSLLFELPGLDHAASKALAGSHLTFLAVSTGTLAGPVPLGPTADLWLDPANLVLIPVPASLELDFTLASDPSLVDGVVPTQVFDIDLGDPSLPLFASDLLEVGLLEPIPDYGVELRPLGADVQGTELVSYDAGSNSYRFTFTDPSAGVTEYLVDLNEPAVQKGSLHVFETTHQVFPSIFAGFLYESGGVEYSPLAFESLGTHTLLGHSLSGNTLRLDYQDDVPALGGGTNTLTRAYELTLVGRSLKVRGFQTGGSLDGSEGYSGFSLGNQAALTPSSSFEQVRVPYMDQIGINLLDDHLFFESFIDLYRSHGQDHQEAGFWTFANLASNTELVSYEVGTSGVRSSIDETGWLTVTERIEDCFVTTNQTKGPYADDFSHMVAMAYSKETVTTSAYLTDKFNVLRMQEWGMDDVLVWKAHWMNAGQNRRATHHTPANPAGGTDAELADFVQTAVSGGWRVAMYTDFYSLDQAQGYDDNPAYSELGPDYINYGDAVKGFDGNYRLGFGIVEDITMPQGSPLYNTRLLSPTRAFEHFEREATLMVSNYGVNANYFDVMTISAPDLIVTGKGLNQGIISGDHTSPNASTIGQALNHYCDLFKGASEFLNGPVLGEGSFWLFERRWDTFYMGFLDGVWRTLSTGGPPTAPGFSGEEQPVIPDYEINVVRPIMPGLFGMGQYTRFFKGQTYPVPYADDPLYEYRATSISYGHNGFLMSLSVENNGDDYLDWAQQIKEYYAMRGLHDEWNAATGAVVEYRDGASPGAWMDLTTALKTDLDLTAPVLRLTYDTGLVVVVNHSGASVVEGGYTLPHTGWAAVNPTTGYLNLSVTEPVSGARIDHVVCADYELGDGNGVAHDFGGAIGVTTDLKVAISSPAKVLSEQTDGTILVQ